MKKILASAFLVLTILLTPHIVSAHALAVACLPRIGSSASKAPDQVICQFNQPLQANTIGMTVTNAKGERVDKNDAKFYQDDDYTVVVSLDAAKMAAGIYTIHWQVTDTLDFGTTTGVLEFGVNTVVPPTATPALPGVAMTPMPVASANNQTTDLISRFLIGIGFVLLVAIGILFWRMRTSAPVEPE